MREIRTSFAFSHLPFSYSLPGDFIDPFILEVDDRSGDNITERKAFSETRGHYWLWKNYRFDDNEFVSLQQYRRCFWFQPLVDANGPFKYFSDIAARYLTQQVLHMKRPQYIEYVRAIDVADKEPLNRWLRGVDVVASRPLDLHMTVAQAYAHDHRAVDWEIFAEACRARGYDDGRHNYLTGHLMYIMRPDIFDEYMTAWWDIMQEVDSKLWHEDDPYQHRKIGYLSERFMSTWLIKQRLERPTLRIQTLPICEGLFQFDRESPDVM